MTKFKNNICLNNLEVNNYLENIIKTNSFANGYIFWGAKGVGKKQTALKFINGIFRNYTSSINIEEKILNNNHPDFLVIEPTSFTKDKTIKSKDSKNLNKISNEIIKVEQIRNVRKFISQKAIDSEKKIVLIIDSHLLNEAASNCLLKTLEEPSNGIFILLTSNINFLLNTIKSRCQLIKFKCFSTQEIESFVKNNLDSYLSEINKKINLQDLVNASNGSPIEALNNIEILKELPNEIFKKLEFPLKDNLEILTISKTIIETLEVYQQIYLINFIQYVWWRKTKNKNVIKKLEKLKFQIQNFIQPRLAWEVTLLRISLEDLRS